MTTEITFHDFLYEEYDEDTFDNLYDGNYAQYLDRFPVEDVFNEVLRNKDLTQQDLRFFMDKGIDIDEMNDRYRLYGESTSEHNIANTPLHLVCYHQDMDKAKVLVQMGADIRRLNENGNSVFDMPFMLNTECPDDSWVDELEKCVKALIDLGGIVPHDFGKNFDKDYLEYMFKHSPYLKTIITNSLYHTIIKKNQHKIKTIRENAQIKISRWWILVCYRLMDTNGNNRMALRSWKATQELLSS